MKLSSVTFVVAINLKLRLKIMKGNGRLKMKKWDYRYLEIILH